MAARSRPEVTVVATDQAAAAARVAAAARAVAAAIRAHSLLQAATATLQLSMPSQLARAVLVIMARPVLPVQKDLLVVQAKTETTAATAPAAKTRNFCPPRQRKFASSALLARPEHPAVLVRKDHPDRKDHPASLHVTEHLARLALPANPEESADLVVTVAADRQEARVVLFRRPVQLVLPARLEYLASKALPDNRDQTASRIQVHPELLVMLAAPALAVVQVEVVPQGQLVKMATRDRANTARLLAHHQATRLIESLRSDTYDMLLQSILSLAVVYATFDRRFCHYSPI